ncbi:hypothetical protein D3C81_2307810 [compost metagenome]
MLERRDGPRRQGREVDAKVGETEVIPQSAPSAVPDQGGEGFWIEGLGPLYRDLG